MSESLQLAQPAWLWALLLLPLVLLLRARPGRTAALRLASLAPAGRGQQPLGRLGWKWLAFVLPALLLCVLALARPQRVQGRTEIQVSGVDLMLAVDVSGSMEALDFQLGGQRTNRLTAVKNVVADFVSDRPGDRIGLLAFASNPYLVTPLTLDHDLLARRLESEVRLGRVEDGTALGTALSAAVNRLRDSEAESRVVILLTDGVNTAGSVAPETVAEAARSLGIRVYTIGAGRNGTAPMPVTDRFGRRAIQRVPVRIDEETLRAIADTTGGRYFRATDTESLEQIYAEIDELEKTDRSVERYEERHELYLWLLVPALGLLLLERVWAETLGRRLP